MVPLDRRLCLCCTASLCTVHNTYIGALVLGSLLQPRGNTRRGGLYEGRTELHLFWSVWVRGCLIWDFRNGWCICGMGQCQNRSAPISIDVTMDGVYVSLLWIHEIQCTGIERLLLDHDTISGNFSVLRASIHTLRAHSKPNFVAWVMVDIFRLSLGRLYSQLAMTEVLSAIARAFLSHNVVSLDVPCAQVIFSVMDHQSTGFVTFIQLIQVVGGWIREFSAEAFQ